MPRSRDARDEPRDLEVDDRADLLAVEPVEHDDVVEAVDELGLERLADRLVVVAGLRADVRGHDQHRVLEVHGAALAVGQAAVVDHLEQRVEDVGVGLLDLVEQHDRVGPAADGLGELAALLVADVAGRRADQARRRCASPCTRDMSMRTIASWESNMNSASARASSVLPTPVGPRKRNEPIGRSGSWSPARERRSALATALDRLVLADDALVQALLHVDELPDSPSIDAA